MVVDKIDQSLDDIIKSNKKSRGGRGGRGGSRGRSNSRGGGPVRNTRGRGRGSNRTTPYTRPRSIPDRWEHDMFDGSNRRQSQRTSTEGLSTGSHLQISNLDFGVNESDIKELFSEFGKLRKVRINYDESGRSHGTADVIFERKPDALKAFNTYNGVPLDGRPMKIEAVTTKVTPTINKPFTNERGRRNSSGGGFRGWRGGRGGGQLTNTRETRSTRGGRGQRGGGRGRGRSAPPSKDQLDRELDSYIEKGES